MQPVAKGELMTTTQHVRTIADIARLAGVSKSTVSRALNDSSLISQETKSRIQAIAAAHDFELHQGARGLSLQTTQTLAVVFPYKPQFGRYVTDHPFNIEMLGALTNAVAEYGYDLVVAQTQQGERKNLERYFASKRADGLILFACDMESEEMVRLVTQRAPFIMWGPPPKDQSYCTVGSDDVRGGYLAAQHLLELGRRRIAFIGGPLGRPEVKLRYKGYVKALREARLRIEENLIAWGDYSSQSGSEKMSALLKGRPDLDAAFVAGDLMAVGAMQALQTAGRRIPQDVAVVGYDGMPLSEYSSPPLTTVRQNIAAAGRLLVHNLLRYLDDGVVSNDVLPVELVTRQSTTG